MTWGSNPSFDTIPCRYCGVPQIDDQDHESTHEQKCTKRTWRSRFLNWAKRT